ncbi:MAG TPA: MarC family protein [Micromonosporaceae bacterium]
MDVRLFGEVFVTLLVITDPAGMLPIFLALTKSMPRRERTRAAWMAVGLAAGVIVVFAVAGQQILAYLGIDLPALQAAGGLLLLLVALELLTGRADDPNRQATANVALVPLGTPLLAGPGAIVATMLFVRRAVAPADYLAIAAGIVLVFAVTWLLLRLCGIVVRVLRPAGIEVVTRISGLLLAAIAVQLVADAVFAFVRQFSATT